MINRQDDCDDDDDTDDDDNDDNDDCVSLTHTPSNQFLHHRTIVINRLDYDDADDGVSQTHTTSNQFFANVCHTRLYNHCDQSSRS